MPEARGACTIELAWASKNQLWNRNVRNLTNSLVSGLWFLSPEAGGTGWGTLGEQGGGCPKPPLFKIPNKKPSR